MSTTYILLLVAMVAIFYLLVYRPQQRAKREKEDLMRRLAVGTEVVTVGGIFGTIASLREEDLDLEVAPGVAMRVDRRAIASVAAVAEEADDEDDDEEWDEDGDEDGEWEDESEDGEWEDEDAGDEADAEDATGAGADAGADAPASGAAADAADGSTPADSA